LINAESYPTTCRATLDVSAILALEAVSAFQVARAESALAVNSAVSVRRLARTLSLAVRAPRRVVKTVDCAAKVVRKARRLSVHPATAFALSARVALRASPARDA
jgi:hypothetical protein